MAKKKSSTTNRQAILLVLLVFIGSIFLFKDKLNLQKPETVRVGLLLSDCNPNYLPFLVASKQGFLDKEGVKFTTPMAKGDYANASSLASKFDIIILGRAQQYTMTASYPGEFSAFLINYLETSKPNYAILVKKESSLTSITQLKGKIIGLENNSGKARNVLIKAILKKNGIDPESISIKDASILDLEDGKVDALYIREPQLSLALSKGTSRILVNEPVANYVMNPWPMSFSSLSKKFLTEKPALAKSAISSFEQATELIRNNPQKAGEILTECMQEKYGVKANVKQVNHWRVDEADRTLLQRQMDFYYENSLIPKRINVNDVLY